VQATPHDSSGTIIIMMPNAGGVGKTCIFGLVKNSLVQMPYCRKFVSIHHGGSRLCIQHGALVEEYAVSSTTLVVVKI